MRIVGALTIVGLVLRVVLARQSLVADEMSTLWVVSRDGLWDVISMVRTDAEITPPLSFVASWLTTRPAVEPELLRAPSVLAGTMAIPLVYLIGRRTIGPRPAILAAALTTFSPFMLHYSAEARGYALMIAFGLLSTLALLVAVDGGGTRWWVVFGAATCAAVYSHYTCVFVLGAQLVWLLWAHPEARRPALIASAAAFAGFLPWLPGLRGDLDSATTEILSFLQPFTFQFVRSSLVHWVIGYPYAVEGEGIRDLPGVPALIALALAVALGTGGLVARRLRAGGAPLRVDRRIVLVVALALAAPVGEAVFSAVGSNVLGTRNLASSWPGVALCLAALAFAAGPRLGLVAAALAFAAYAVAGLKLLDPDFRRPDYRSVAEVIDREAAPGDVVVDAARISPAGVPPPLQAALERPHRIVPIGAHEVYYDPFRILAPAPAPAVMIARAVKAAGAHRLFLVLVAGTDAERQALAALPPGSRRLETRAYPGVDRLILVVVDPQTASGA